MKLVALRRDSCCVVNLFIINLMINTDYIGLSDCAAMKRWRSSAFRMAAALVLFSEGWSVRRDWGVVVIRFKWTTSQNCHLLNDNMFLLRAFLLMKRVLKVLNGNECLFCKTAARWSVKCTHFPWHYSNEVLYWPNPLSFCSQLH